MTDLGTGAPRILIACIGNIFLGDDGFGTAVALRMAARELPPGVVVRDFGIRGLDLAYALLDRPGFTILVDACSRGTVPGTVFLIEPEFLETGQGAESAALDPHGMNPESVLRMVRSMDLAAGGAAPRMLIVGCEPEDLGPEEGKMGLSATVAAAVNEAVELIESLVSKYSKGGPGCARSEAVSLSH